MSAVCLVFSRWLLRVVLPLLLLCGCSGGGNYAPVADRENSRYQAVDHYVVSKGETLYSIAWRYGIDFKQLASTNGIESPYTIHPGQTLSLKVGAKPVSTAAGKTVQTKKTSSAKVESRPKSVPTKKPQRQAKSIDRKQYPFRWQWPSSATLAKRFRLSGKVHKGIDLKGKLREPVYAANSGEVVYAGSGLVGYGKLLIIKHNDRYLSAYGHNHRLLVAEGEKVKVGQRIAEMGNTGAEEVKLHFEIRRDGKPVDPLKVLPKRT